MIDDQFAKKIRRCDRSKRKAILGVKIATGLREKREGDIHTAIMLAFVEKQPEPSLCSDLKEVDGQPLMAGEMKQNPRYISRSPHLATRHSLFLSSEKVVPCGERKAAPSSHFEVLP